MNKLPRVCVGPLEVAGIAAGLVAGLRGLGAPADAVLGASHRFGYRHPAPSGWLPRLWMRLGSWRRSVPASRVVAKSAAVLLHRAAGWAMLGWVLPRYDAFVFLYGETFTNSAFELRLMRALHRRTVVVFVGSDARPPVIDGAIFPADREVDGATLARATARQRRRVQRLERLADLCINAPATAQFHRRRVVDWFALGLPRTVATMRSARQQVDGPLRVLHSPSHPVMKGSAQIAAAVERLRARGIAVEWVALEGVPNDRVLEEIAHCDVVIDQLYSDTPMAALAAEAAALGKPVLVGGYFAAGPDAARASLPRPPTLFVPPEQLDEALLRLATDPELRRDLGTRAQAFVGSDGPWHPVAVAARLLRMLRGDIPADWWLDPAGLGYVHGCGLSAAMAARRIRTLIDHAGRGALGVADKPALEAAFVALADTAAAR